MANLDYQYLADLVVRAQTGDSDAFAELYIATYQKQYRFAYNYLKDSYLAQDAIQETYILALKNITTLRDPQVFISCLNQITLRVCFNMHREQQMYRTEFVDLDFDYADPNTNKKHDPEALTISVDEKKYIIRQVMSLPFSESQAIILRYYHNMKIDDIAKMMEISRSSVKRYLISGRNKLAKLIER